MKTLNEYSLTGRALAWLARAVCRRPRMFFYPQIVLFGLAVFYTVTSLEFDTSRSGLVGADKKYHQNFLQFRQEFPQQDDLVVVVESENTEKNRQFVERLGARLEAETNLFTDVFYKGDLKMMGPKALLFVSEPDLVEMKETLGTYRLFVGKFAQATNLTSLFAMVNTQFRTSPREVTAETEALIEAIPALKRIITQAASSLRHPGTPPSPGINALFGAGDEVEREIYITFGNGRIYLVTAHAPREELSGAAVDRLRELVNEIRREVPGVNAGITGEPVLEHDEMVQAQKDTMIASVAALIVCALIFIYGYQETGRPVKATLCLVVGLGYTLGFATLVIGHLNILTITFVPILIGLAIDFGVHLITRYEEELRHGQSEEAALTKAMVFTGQGIFTGAFTTAGAFLAMGLTDFKGIQEMGIICGGGLLICLIPMMTLLPVLLLRGRQNVLDHQIGEGASRRARIERIWLDRPVTVVVATVILCALAASQLPKLEFDYNLLHMQSAGLPAVEFEKKLIESAAAVPADSDAGTNGAGRSVLFAAVMADSLEEALRLEEEIRQLPAVASVDSIAGYLTEEPGQKLRLIGEIKQELAGIRFAEPDRNPVDIPELSLRLYGLSGYVGLALERIGTNDPALNRQFLDMDLAIKEARKEMLQGSPVQIAAKSRKLADFQQALFNDLRETFQSLQHQDNSARLRAEDLPPAIRNRFVGRTGKYLLQVYPNKDVWQRENQEVFIRELRTIDPDVTGTPVQLYHYTELLRRSYVEAAWYALGAIVLLVLIHFRSLTSLFLALVPVALGSLWLGGVMSFFGIPLNPANIMTLPLVIGIGVTNGIHILNRFAEEQQPSILAKSTGKAVLVSGLTTIAGFGSLALAKHQGIQSLGYVMAAGVATCMIAGLTFLPAMLNLIGRRNPKTKQPSADNARSTLGQEEPR